MALFDLGTPTPRRGQQTPKAPPARYRPIGRMEGSDPEIRALYERQKKQWEKEVGEERKKEVYEPFLAGRTPTQVVEQMRGEQRARSAADVAKAREDMASGKTSTLVGKQSEALKKVPTKQVFKAMVVGDPTQSQVFDSKEEAEAYLKKTGQQGAVAGIRVSGTPEEMKGSIAKYKEQAVSGKKKEEELKGLYEKRMGAAKERYGNVKSGEITAQDAATLRAAERIAESDPARAEQLQEGYSRNVQARLNRESEIERQRARNVAEGKAGMPFGESQRITKMENRANRIARDLRGMYDKAVRAGNYEAALDIDGLIKETLGTDPSNVTARRKFFREKLNRANPF
jgi:hypothetical protein